MRVAGGCGPRTLVVCRVQLPVVGCAIFGVAHESRICAVQALVRGGQVNEGCGVSGGQTKYCAGRLSVRSVNLEVFVVSPGEAFAAL